MYKLDIQLEDGSTIKKELDEVSLRRFINKRPFGSVVRWANVVTPSGATKSITKYLK